MTFTKSIIKLAQEPTNPFRKHQAHNSIPNKIQRKHVERRIDYSVYREKAKLVDPSIIMNQSIDFNNLKFDKRKEGELRIITWNVQGLISAQKNVSFGFD